MYKKSILFMNIVFLTTLITGCATTRQLPEEDDHLLGSEDKLIIVKENSQEELLIECT